TALHTYKNGLYLQADIEKKLTQLLANCEQNSNYGYGLHLFKQYYKQAHTKLQEYDSQLRKSYILFIVTNLISCVYEKIYQVSKLGYINILAFFESLKH
ncbi:20242_t:CDS:2, partial [Gigaspora margarita]